MSLRADAGRALLATAMLTVVLTIVAGGMSRAVARADECPNERLRGQDGYALALPDCRAYEQVSPVEKNFSDALGEADVVQSSPSGSGVTFFSRVPFPGLLSATSPSLYLSTRAEGEWSSRGLVPTTAPSSLPEHGSAFVLSLTEGLSEAIDLVEPGLEVGMAPGHYSYIGDTAAGSSRLLAPGIARFADAADNGSRIIFESEEQLMPNAAPGVVNLYEWNGSKPPGEQLSLAGVLPEGEVPSGGSVAGPGGPALGGATGGATGGFYTQGTISRDGSRIFFSDAGTGQIYMREPATARTIPVSAGTEPAYWQAAIANGSEVFYIEGEDLYRFDVNKFDGSKKPEAEALAEAREALTSGAAGVLGTLGIATENGSYAYFVATGVLAGNDNGNKEIAEIGKVNLYEWHSGGTIFVARLSTRGKYDEYDWRDFYSPNFGPVPATGEKSSRVTADGTTVLFASRAQLTAYNNANQGELYLYDATTGRPVCISCNPSAVPATSEAYLAGNLSVVEAPERNAFLTRNLSADGGRVFFQTKEALVPQDTNEQTDVYEWEREGASSCDPTSAGFNASSGGCLSLISTGRSSDRSYFGDASADGSDVFFFTRQSLVGQDRDENDDLYDARVEGGIAAQNPLPRASCTGEGCLEPVDVSPVFAAPSSATLAGVGNAAPRPKVKPRPLSRAQKLASSRQACGHDGSRRSEKRRKCETRARKRYGMRAAKSAYARRVVRKRHGQ